MPSGREHTVVVIKVLMIKLACHWKRSHSLFLKLETNGSLVTIVGAETFFSNF